MTRKPLSSNADGRLFSTFRRDARKLSVYLADRASEIQVATGLRPLNLTLSDDEIVRHLTLVLDLHPPSIGTATKHHKTKKYFGRTVYQAALVLPIDGSKELVDHWPDERPEVDQLAEDDPIQKSGFDLTPPYWTWNDEGDLEFRLLHEGDAGIDLEGQFSFQEARARAIVLAVAEQTKQFIDQFQDRLEAWVKEERHKSDAARELYEAIPLPEYRPPQIRVIHEPNQSADLGAHPDVVVLPPRLEVIDGDWKTYLWVVQRWASVVEHNPKSFSTLDEYALRDLLLATLSAVYPMAQGEVMNAGKKTDILVTPDPSRPDLAPIITELKIGSGPKLVQDSVAQHLGQLSVRETKGTLIFFIRALGWKRAEWGIKKAIETSPGFGGWVDQQPEAGWSRAIFRPPDEAQKRVDLYIGSIVLRG